MSTGFAFHWSSKSVKGSRPVRNRDTGHQGVRLFPKWHCTVESLLCTLSRLALYILLLGTLPIGAAQSQNTALCALVSSTTIVGLGSSWECDQTGAPIGDPCLWFGVQCDINNGVVSLELSFEALLGTLPSEIGLLTSLTTFNMGYNSLSGTLPSSIGCLSNLESLYMDHNHLSAVANTFSTMNSLTALDLQSNSLFGPMPSSLGQMSKIVSIDMSQNKLGGSVPEGLCFAVTLTNLSFALNAGITCYSACLSSVLHLDSGNKAACTPTPTVAPTTAPTVAPTVVPTVAPTTAPTVAPTVVPTVAPTTAPTVAPTVVPTVAPTTAPTVAPTVVPTVAPTTAPTVAPTVVPTVAPTTAPTVAPTVVPTVAPTTAPLGFPTVVPTVAPTTAPTVAPTTAPIGFPTVVPTVAPTTAPIGFPTVVPTVAPTTAPTVVPTSVTALGQPTSHPSVAPSFVADDYEGLGIYSSFIGQSAAMLDDADTSTFGIASFIYKGNAVIGTRGDVDLLFGSLSLPSDNLFYSRLQVAAEFVDFGAATAEGAAVRECSDETSLQSIVSHVIAGLVASVSYGAVVQCNGSAWNVFSCGGVVNLCLDCAVNVEDPCTADLCPGRNHFILNNPFTVAFPNCEYSSTAAYAVMKWTVGAKALYPEFNGPLTTSTTTTSISVSANASSSGTMYCAAFSKGYFLLSTSEISNQGFAASFEAANEVQTVVISGLAPESNYEVYCYTEDFESHFMPLDVAATTLLSVSTPCCRAIEFTSSITEIVEYDATSTAAEFVFTFRIDALPTSNIVVSVAVAAVQCDATVPTMTGFTSSTAPSVFPASFLYSPSSPALVNSFVVRGVPGCYSVEVLKTAGADTYTSVSLSPFLYIRSTSAVPDPPVVTSAAMANDGRSVSVLFNSDTDRGASVGLSNRLGAWTCSDILSFSGSAGAKCVWTSKRLITVTGGTPVHSTAMTLLASKLQPACPSGYNCAADSRYTVNPSSSTATISAPPNPVRPIPSISTSASVGGCNDIVLDPTLSTNSGGRSWAGALWTVTSVPADSLSPFDNDAIAATLYSQGGSGMKTSSLLTIPNSMLVAGTLTVTLKLTNFMGGVALLSKSIVVSSNTVDPTVAIIGTATQSIFRVNPLTVVARATVPTCNGGASSKAVNYAWKVFRNGITYEPGIVNTAIDARSFKLPGYSLESSTDYSIQVVASLVSNPAAKSSAYVTVRVLSSGVEASFVGGLSRTVSVAESFTVDAGASYSIDYPAQALAYRWSCAEMSPVFGAPCGLTLPTTSFLNFAAFGSPSGLTLAPAKQYTITVFVSNNISESDSATTTITTTSDAVPKVTMAEVASKYNPERKIVLSADIVGASPFNVTWALEDDLPISAVSLTATNKLLQAGTITFELGLRANSFTAGLSYTFTLVAFYPSSSGDPPEPTTVTIHMNAPPSDGSLVVSPTTGTAMDTLFLLQTQDWVDDADDYPLLYVISYYAFEAQEQTVLKTAGIQSYARDVLLGQGMAANDYNVTCYVSASDSYGGTAAATTGVRVGPVTNLTALADTANTEIADAFESGDSAAVSQVVGAVSSAANAVVCDFAPDCAALNRSVCATTANTCSECLDGYLGDSGDANTLCSDPSVLWANGQACSENGVCQSGLCADGVCRAKPKSCQLGANNLECSGSGHGSCVFVRNTGERVSTCFEDDISCRAKCTCEGAYEGATCSLSSAELDNQKEMRETLCASVYGLQAIQDITADVVRSRATAVAAVLKNIEEVSETALVNCTLALTQTITAALVQSPAYIAGDAEVTESLSEALSAVLEKGSDLPPSLVVAVEEAVDAMTTALHSLMAVGEDPACTATDNMNTCVAKAFVADALLTTYTPAQTDVDLFNSVPVTTITLESTSARRRLADAVEAVVEVAVVQRTSNPHDVATNSTSVALTVASTTSDVITSVIVLQNVEAIEYASVDVVNGTATCTGVEESISATCPDGSTYSFECTAGNPGNHSYSCPGSTITPECTFWDGDAFVANPNCEVVSYTNTTTTCACRTSSTRLLLSALPPGHHHSKDVSYHDLRHRVLSQQQRFAHAMGAISDASSPTMTYQQHNSARKLGSMDQEIASQATVVGSDFGSRFSSISSLTLADITRNIVVFSICLSLLCMTVVGLAYFVFVDIKESKRSAQEKELDRRSLKSLRKVFDFFNILLPDELSSEPMWQRLWRKILVEHDYFCMLMPYNKERSLRSLKFVQGMSLILNFMFIDTILAGLFFDDGGTCQKFTTQEKCLLTNSLDQVTPLCSWNSDTETCSFEGPSESFLSTLILTMIITTCAVPLDKMIEKCLDEVKVFVELVAVRTSGEIYAADDLPKQEMGDELKDVQTLQNTLLRGARLVKMQRTMDCVSPEEEIYLMMEDHAKIAAAASVGAASTRGGTKHISRVVEHNLIRDSILYGEFEEAQRGDHSKLLGHLIGAIDEATYIRQQLSLIEGEDAREIYLLQRFLADSLQGVRKWIAERIMFAHIETEEEVSDHSTRRVCVLIFVVLYFCFVSLYIFLFGVSIGPKSTNLWLIGCLQAFLMDIFLLQPCKIWMQRIAISSFAGREIQQQHEVLRDRSISIMKRCDGLMKYSSSLVQHFNPACRAARHFPELPAARLLMSLSDYDLPLNKFEILNPTLADILYDYMTYFGMAIMVVLVVLPEVVQESGIEIFITGVVNCSFLIAYYMSKLFVAVPVVLFFLFVGLLVRQNQLAMARYASTKKQREFELREKARILCAAASGEAIELCNWKERAASSIVMGNVMHGFDRMKSRRKEQAAAVPVSAPLVDCDKDEGHRLAGGGFTHAHPTDTATPRVLPALKPSGPPPVAGGADHSAGVSFFSKAADGGPLGRTHAKPVQAAGSSGDGPPGGPAGGPAFGPAFGPAGGSAGGSAGGPAGTPPEIPTGVPPGAPPGGPPSSATIAANTDNVSFFTKNVAV